MKKQKQTIISILILLLTTISIYYYQTTYSNYYINNNLINKDIFNKVQDITENNFHKILCENLIFQPNAEQLLKENNCNIEKTSKDILDVKNGIVKNLNTQIKWNNRSYAVTIWGKRLEIMLKQGLSKDRILDLLTIMTLECNKYSGKCDNGNDIGPFQINKIHKEWYNTSKQLLNENKLGELFIYQLDKANKLLNRYEKTNCNKKDVIKYGLGKTYEEKKWRCIAFLYNGHPRYKFAYNKLGWEKRKIISNFLDKNIYLK